MNKRHKDRERKDKGKKNLQFESHKSKEKHGEQNRSGGKKGGGNERKFDGGSAYYSAAKVLETVLTTKASIRSTAFSSSSSSSSSSSTSTLSPTAYALACETIKYKSVLDQILRAPSSSYAVKPHAKGNTKSSSTKSSSTLLTQIQHLIPSASDSLIYVMVYDLLLGKGSIDGGGKVKRELLNYRSELVSSLVKLKARYKAFENKDLLPPELRNPVTLPRYVRVNLLKATMEDVIEHFKKEGYQFVEEGDGEEEGQTSTSTSTPTPTPTPTPTSTSTSSTTTPKPSSSPKRFWRDKHLGYCLLVFPSSMDFHSHPLLLEGKIILQDKASCFPSHILSAPSGSQVIDSCSAPGNKTSFVAATMNNTGNLYAFEKSSNRFKTLTTLLNRNGVKNVTPLNRDFLESDPFSPEFAKVEYLLVDPSCSGSGIVGRLEDYLKPKEEVEDDSPKDFDTNEEDEGKSKERAKEDRLASLAAFQKKILLHAMKFPAAKRVVYSTCSVHREENEDVVSAVLSAQSDWKLAPCFSEWKRRGLSEIPGMQHCIRTIITEDQTIGFFVACFERRSTAGSGVAVKRKEPDDVPFKQQETETSARKKRRKKKSKKSDNTS